MIKTLIFSAVLLVCLVGVVLQHRSISTLESENKSLAVRLSEAVELQSQNRPPERPQVETEEAIRLKQENRELPKLRNEVYQLRRQTNELGELHLANERFRAAVANSGTRTTPTMDIRSKLAAGDLQFAGYASPEATFQTLYWAMRQGDFNAQIRCYSADILAVKDLTETLRQQFARAAEDMRAKLQAIRIAAKKEVSPGEIMLGVQTWVAEQNEPQEGKLFFRLIDGEWKLSTPK